jgi:hypothetical protein
MRPEKRFFLVMVCALAAALVAGGWYGISRYRQAARCSEGKKAFMLRVESLTRDAHAQLTIGRNQADVARFFAANGITLEISKTGDHQEATGALQMLPPKGCEAQCAGRGGAIRVLVVMSSDGIVLSPGFVFASGSNCM